jgi:zinc protease
MARWSPDGIVPRIRPQEPPQLAERRMVLADERVSEPYLFRTYLAPNATPATRSEAAALTVLAELLGGNGQTSVLARALQFDRRSRSIPRPSMTAPADRRRHLRPGGDAGPGRQPGRSEAALDKVMAIS